MASAAAASTTVSSSSTVASKPALTPFQKFASVFREAHPIGRVPTYLKPHDAPPLSHYLRRMGRTGKVFAPFMVAFCKYLPFRNKNNASPSIQEKNPHSSNFLISIFLGV
jgi:hypothetical protein